MYPSLPYHLLLTISPFSPHTPYRVHFRSLNSGTVHPSALGPGYLSHTPEGTEYSFAFQTSGDFVGVLFTSQGDSKNELLIWNWKKGTLEFVRILPYPFHLPP